MALLMKLYPQRPESPVDADAANPDIFLLLFMVRIPFSILLHDH
jgi:hypothetical protein